MMRRPRLSWLAVAAAISYSSGALCADEQKLTCPMGRDYYLYVPDKIDPDRTYWLVAGIHGFKGTGKGAGGYADWIQKENCLVVGPTMPDGYQGLGLETDAQLIGIAKALGEKYRLHSKMFVAGFSGGAQFAHRFAVKHPDFVAGCAAQSAGSWAAAVTPSIRGIPFAISCGQNDTEKSPPDASLSRIEWAKNFADLLVKNDAYCKIRYWPNVGHAQGPGSRQLADDCFTLATTGLHESQLPPVRQEYQAVDALLAKGRFAEAQTRAANLPKVKFAADSAPAKQPAGVAAAGLKEDKFGWHAGEQGGRAAEAARQAFLDELAAELTRKIERRVLEQIAAIADNPTPAALRQLTQWQKDFADNKNVQAAIQAALRKAKAGSPQ